jgi:hypothetical protein
VQRFRAVEVIGALRRDSYFRRAQFRLSGAKRHAPGMERSGMERSAILPKRSGTYFAERSGPLHITRSEYTVWGACKRIGDFTHFDRMLLIICGHKR